MYQIGTEKRMIYIGKNSLNSLISNLLKKEYRQIFIMTDQNLIKICWFKELIDKLEKAGITCRLFSDISENPKISEIRKGVELLNHHPWIPVVAVGGGSVLDAAKMIALLPTDDDIMCHTIHSEKQVLFRNKPRYLIAIPTTAGSGSEMNSGATVVAETGHKYSVADDLMFYDEVYEDYSLLRSCPKSVLIACAFDSFCHSYEALLNNPDRALNFFAVEAIKEVIRHLENVISKGDDADFEGLMKASMLSGCVLGMDLPSGGMLIHSLSLPLVERYHLRHGHALALVAPYISEMIYQSQPERMQKLAKKIGYMDADSFIKKVKKMLKNIGLEKPKEMWIEEQDIEWMSELAVQSKTTTMNPVLPFSKAMVKQLYRQIAEEK